MSQTKDGAVKCAAVRIGMSHVDYIERIQRGLKRCTCCKDWRSVDEFGVDRHRFDGRAAKCKACVVRIKKSKYTPVPPSQRKPLGPSPHPNRDGDKLQARLRANQLVKRGIIPAPDDLPCSECGHHGPDRRHEYHHHRGYAAPHHEDVVPLCTRCHHKAHPRKTSP